MGEKWRELTEDPFMRDLSTIVSDGLYDFSDHKLTKLPTFLGQEGRPADRATIRRALIDLLMRDEPGRTPTDFDELAQMTRFALTLFGATPGTRMLTTAGRREAAGRIYRDGGVSADAIRKRPSEKQPLGGLEWRLLRTLREQLVETHGGPPGPAIREPSRGQATGEPPSRPATLVSNGPESELAATWAATWPSFPYERFIESIHEASAYVRILQTWIPDLQPFMTAIVKAAKRGVAVQLLVLNPGCDAAKRRLTSLGTVDDHYPAIQASKLRADLRHLANATGASEIEARTYEVDPLAQIYATDRRLWVGYFWPGRFSLQAPQIELCPSTSALASELNDYFTGLWDDSPPLDGPRS